MRPDGDVRPPVGSTVTAAPTTGSRHSRRRIDDQRRPAGVIGNEESGAHRLRARDQPELIRAFGRGGRQA